MSIYCSYDPDLAENVSTSILNYLKFNVQKWWLNHSINLLESYLYPLYTVRFIETGKFVSNSRYGNFTLTEIDKMAVVLIRISISVQNQPLHAILYKSFLWVSVSDSVSVSVNFT